jgi:hypothetical protein
MMIHSRCHDVDTVTIRLSIIRRQTLLVSKQNERIVSFSRESAGFLTLQSKDCLPPVFKDKRRTLLCC